MGRDRLYKLIKTDEIESIFKFQAMGLKVGNAEGIVPEACLSYPASKAAEVYECTMRLTSILKLAIERMANFENSRFRELQSQIQTPIPDWSEQTRDFSTGLIRADFIFHNGIPKFLELNVHTSMGGIVETQVLTTHYINQALARKRGEPIFGISPIPAMTKWLLDKGFENIAYLDLELDRRRKMHADITASFGLDLGYQVLDDLRRRQEYYLKAFTDYALNPALHETDKRIVQLHKTSNSFRRRLLPNSWSDLMESKYWFAYLHEDVSKFSTSDRAWIKKHIPQTYFLQRSDRRVDLSHRENWVLKPVGSDSGNGIVVGREVSSEIWSKSLKLAEKDAEKYCIQKYVEADLIIQPLRDRHGRLITQEMIPVFSQYCFGGAPGGWLTRMSPLKGGSVVNASKGAVINVALFRDYKAQK